MPESPEVMFNAIVLNKILHNSTIVSLSATNRERHQDLPNHANNHVIGVESKGKLMWIAIKKTETENYYIHIHFGTKGKLETNKPEKNLRYEMVFRKGTDGHQRTFSIYMEDSDFRQLAKVTVETQEEHDKIVGELGTSIFSPEFTETFFADSVKAKKTKIISLLMNQHTFSGIGNYIKNDAMYLSNIHINTYTKSMTNEQIKSLYHNILFVAYSVLMTHLREYNDLKDLGISLHDPLFRNKPMHVEVPYEYKIYGRTETADGKAVKKIKVDGRDTYCVRELCD
jgi:formamidopyrimidine-DNA glycosylase